ncbi:MAG: lipocalin family protein [Cyclobacteriaceae bacterium]|nr:lipocalin family protein [Cyclobacteriaceae bacterium]
MLPSGSMEDKRMLSTVSAALFLEEESKKVNVKISTAEVFQLPSRGYSLAEFRKALDQAGWTILPVDGLAQYGWLQRGNEYLLYYYNQTDQFTDLYIGKPDGTPVLPANQPADFNQQASQQLSTPRITGTWYKVSATSGNTTYGYIKCQYTFRDDGSYVYYSKTFDVYTPQMVLRKETGTYTLNGNLLSVTPGSSVVQTWSKKDNADKWGTMLKAQQATPENTTYTLRFEKFGDKLNLLLSPVNGRTTVREGAFGINSNFPNTYFYEIPPANSYLIELPEGEKPAASEKKN